MLRNLALAMLSCVKNPYRHGMSGNIDGVYFGSLRGWAKADDGTVLTLAVKKNGIYIGECRANGPRADLAAKGIGDGRYGFSLPLPGDFTVNEGDIVEAVDSAVSSRVMALRVTRRMVARPNWRYPVQREAGDATRSPSGPSTPEACDAIGESLQSGEPQELATAYEKLVMENRQLRASVAQHETEVHLNRLQLRQVQEELEGWYVKYLDLQATVAAAQRVECETHDENNVRAKS